MFHNLLRSTRSFPSLIRTLAYTAQQLPQPSVVSRLVGRLYPIALFVAHQAAATCEISQSRVLPLKLFPVYAAERDQERHRTLAVAPLTGAAYIVERVRTFISRAFRSIYVVLLFTPVVLTAPVFLYILPRSYLSVWYGMIVRAIERTGCAAIKLGQWLSHREDFVDPGLCVHLRTLRSNAPAHSAQISEDLILQAFGADISELFERFDRVPVASGSVAQIHYALLKTNSGPVPVAVKVRHPGVEHRLRMDIALFVFWTNFLSKIPGLRWMRIPISMREFADSLISQVDLSVEADNLTRFHNNFSNRPDINVAFPTPVPSLISPSVMAETWESGVPMQYSIDTPVGDRNKILATTGYNVFMTMMLVDNFMHADCHAGNLLVRETPNSRSPTLVVLDAGLVAEMTTSGAASFRSLLIDVAQANGVHAADMFLSLSNPAPPPALADKFRAEMKELFDKRCTNVGGITAVLQHGASLQSLRDAVSDKPPINVGALVTDVMSLVRKHKLTLESEFAMVIVSISVLEGLARALDPQIDLIARLVPFLVTEAKSRARGFWSRVLPSVSSGFA